MKRHRFSEEQMAAVLQDQDMGMKIADVCKKHGISSPTLYIWRARHDGTAQALKLKEVEEQNVQLRRLLADAMLDNVLLKEVAKGS